MPAHRLIRGDFQTPDALAGAICHRLASQGIQPAAVIEPTCGIGGLLAAARARWPQAVRWGLELNPDYVAQARARLPEAQIEQGDIFRLDWAHRLQALHEQAGGPLLILGNPPWITADRLTRLGGANAPARHNDRSLPGLAAITGQGNFDVSEWLWLTLAQAAPAETSLALLCKGGVARRVVAALAELAPQAVPQGFWRLDARRHFKAAVDAGLLLVQIGGPGAPGRCPVASDLDSSLGGGFGVVDGLAVADLDAWAQVSHLRRTHPEHRRWRSGIKHDCAPVMELERTEAGWQNGLGEQVDIEPECCLPLVKGRDLLHGTHEQDTRRVVVPQRSVGASTDDLAQRAPHTWAYLDGHRVRLAARRSRIYRGRPPFSIFGVGPYAFAPWKVAISGLGQSSAFRLIGPRPGPDGPQPVMLDDTCYGLACDSEDEARRLHAALQQPQVQAFLSALAPPGAKRPITQRRLEALSLEALTLSTPNLDAQATPPSGTHS